MDDVDRTSVLTRLARHLAQDRSDDPVELRLCRAYLAILGGAGAAVTVAYTDADRVTLCTTDDIADRLEDLQHVLGEGPGPTAYRTETFTTADLSGQDVTGSPWPLFTAAAREIPGAVALYAVPIRPWNDKVIGVLTVHQDQTRFPPEDQATFLANAIGAALMKDPPDDSGLGGSLWTPRAQIHQATGMVVSQLRIAPDDALALLRAHAFSHNTTLAAVADQVITRRLDFSDDAESETP